MDTTSHATTALKKKDKEQCIEEWEKTAESGLWIHNLPPAVHPPPGIQHVCLHQGCEDSAEKVKAKAEEHQEPG